MWPRHTPSWPPVSVDRAIIIIISRHSPHLLLMQGTLWFVPRQRHRRCLPVDLHHQEHAAIFMKIRTCHNDSRGQRNYPGFLFPWYWDLKKWIVRLDRLCAEWRNPEPDSATAGGASRHRAPHHGWRHGGIKTPAGVNIKGPCNYWRLSCLFQPPSFQVLDLLGNIFRCSYLHIILPWLSRGWEKLKSQTYNI